MGNKTAEKRRTKRKLPKKGKKKDTRPVSPLSKEKKRGSKKKAGALQHSAEKKKPRTQHKKSSAKPNTPET